MAVQLVGIGGLFSRLGLIGRLIAQVNYDQTHNLVDDVQLLGDEFEQNRILVDFLRTQLVGQQSSMLGLPNFLRDTAQQTVIEQVNADQPLPDLALSTALAELIHQMRVNEVGVEPSNTTYTITPWDTNNAIDAQVVVSLREKQSGLLLENCFSEIIGITVTADAQEGAAVLGSEFLQARGEYSTADSLDWPWPQGSACSDSLQAVNAALSNAGGNLLTNGSFDPATFSPTSGQFANWVTEVGLSQIDAELTAHDAACVSTGAMGMVGDGTTHTAISQKFGDSVNGTAAVLYPQRQYALNMWIGVDVSPAAGVLAVELVDTHGNVTVDDQGNQNAFHVLLAGMAPVCVPVSGVFRTPRALPSPLKLRIRLVTPLSAGSNLILDHIAMAEMVELYNLGPSVAVFSGAYSLIRQDRFDVTITNDRAGLWHTLFQRLFDTNSLRLILPSAYSDFVTDGTDGTGIAVIDQSILNLSGNLSACSLNTLSLDGLASLLAF